MARDNQSSPTEMIGKVMCSNTMESAYPFLESDAIPYSARACTFLSLPADNLRDRVVCEVSHYVCLRTV